MKTSIVWLTEKEHLQSLLDCSCSFSEVMRKLGYTNLEGNLRTLKQRIKADGLDTTKLIQNRINLMVSKTKSKRISSELMFVENSTAARKDVKKRIIEEKLIEYKCQNCPNDGNWYGERLSLHLEHKNGINNDNRLVNLCFLCPNCHSLTKTYAGKKNKGVRKIDC